MLSRADRVFKRIFDIIVSVVGIIVGWWIMLLAWIIASFETKSNGLFIQERIGKDAKPFFLYKIKTMKGISGLDTTITTSEDLRITKSGKFFRRWKIDELPQLFNVLFGSMSMVGPRPDVSGFADKLEGKDRDILKIRPGITGPASLKYKDEENLLATKEDPEYYNKKVIWPDKVKINLAYLENWTLKKDIMILVKTVLG